MDRVISKVKDEWLFLRSNHQFLSVRLIIGVALSFSPWIVSLLIRVEGIGYIAWALGNYILANSVAEYALLRGRSEYWGFLGLIGMVVLLLSENLYKNSKANKESNKDYLWAGLLGITLIFWSRIGSYYALLGPDEFRENFSIFAGNIWLGRIALAVLLILPIYCLITNRRKVFNLSGWLLILFIFLILLFNTNGASELIYNSENDLARTFIGYRNMFYLFAALYIPLHFVIHGISKFKSKRKLLTVKGIMDMYLQTVTMTLLYALVDLVV